MGRLRSIFVNWDRQLGADYQVNWEYFSVPLMRVDITITNRNGKKREKTNRTEPKKRGGCVYLEVGQRGPAGWPVPAGRPCVETSSALPSALTRSPWSKRDDAE